MNRKIASSKEKSVQRKNVQDSMQRKQIKHGTKTFVFEILATIMKILLLIGMAVLLMILIYAMANEYMQSACQKKYGKNWSGVIGGGLTTQCANRVTEEIKYLH